MQERHVRSWIAWFSLAGLIVPSFWIGFMVGSWGGLVAWQWLLAGVGAGWFVLSFAILSGQVFRV